MRSNTFSILATSLSTLSSGAPRSRLLASSLLLIALGASGCSSAESDDNTDDALASDVAGNDMAMTVEANASFDWVDEARCLIARSYTLFRSESLLDQALQHGAKTNQAGPAVEVDGTTQWTSSHVGNQCVVHYAKTVYLTESSFAAPAAVDENTIEGEALKQAQGFAGRGKALTGAKLRVTYGAPTKTRRVFPEYDKLLADQTLSAVLIVKDADLPEGVQPRLANYEALSTKLRALGYTQTAYEFAGRSASESLAQYRDQARSFTRTLAAKSGPIKVRIDLFSQDWNRSRAAFWTHLQRPFAEALFAADFVRAGGSGVETSVRQRAELPGMANAKSVFDQGGPSPGPVPAWPAHQVWFDGIVSSAYSASQTPLTDTASAATTSAQADVDIVRSVYFSDTESGPSEDVTANAFVNVLERVATELTKAESARRSWNDLLREQNAAPNASMRLTGARMSDNRWSPPNGK